MAGEEGIKWCKVLFLLLYWFGGSETFSVHLGAAVESKRILSFHFDKIEASGALTIFVQPGKRNRQIKYFADSSIIDSIIATVKNRTLYLDANNSFLISHKIPLLRLSAQRTFPIEVMVSIDQLSEFRLLEDSRARLIGVSGDELKLHHNSSGSLEVVNSNFNKISIRQEGSGDVVLKGRETQELDARIFGSGSLLCEELFLENAVLRHYGSGQIMLAPTSWLDAQIFSTGNLHLLEKPLGKVIKNEGKGGKIIEEY